MTTIEEFHAVSDVLQSYLHQDFEDAEEAVAAAVRDANRKQLQAAIEQMPKLIELVGFARREVEVSSLFIALGINYRPEAHGLSPKEWLQGVLDCMKRELDTRPS